MWRRRLLSFCSLLAVSVSLISAPVPGAAAPHMLLFGASELPSSDITLFPQWSSALMRHASDEPTAILGSLVERLGGADHGTQLAQINAWINRVSYIEDRQNWGSSDYWSTPAQFFLQGGDCEDFAIAKYIALRMLGFPAEHLRVAIVYDEAAERNHAVLAVYTKRDILVLDNQFDRAVSASSIHHYRPLYSINEQGWWLH